MSSQEYKPVLIVVDFQEDFCPPNGALAVPEGRSIAPVLNNLLSLPFPLKLATRDWHPRKHVSFASNHGPDAKPFTSTTTIAHPSDPKRSYDITLWPDHCVQMTPGAELAPELDQEKLDDVVDKGMVSSVEMYSPFYDPFRVSDSGLAGRLKRQGVTHVFVAGLAADYCVKATAEHAADEGFTTYIIEEGTKPVSPEKWDEVRKGIVDHGVKMISIDSEEVGKVKALG
ncbi:isochorismatase family protein [Sarocladium implicatum]|nr:isochorismatase family protein [Sarocladium implicatum]